MMYQIVQQQSAAVSYLDLFWLLPSFARASPWPMSSRTANPHPPFAGRRARSGPSVQTGRTTGFRRPRTGSRRPRRLLLRPARSHRHPDRPDRRSDRRGRQPSMRGPSIAGYVAGRVRAARVRWSDGVQCRPARPTSRHRPSADRPAGRARAGRRHRCSGPHPARNDRRGTSSAGRLIVCMLASLQFPLFPYFYFSPSIERMYQVCSFLNAPMPECEPILVEKQFECST